MVALPQGHLSSPWRAVGLAAILLATAYVFFEAFHPSRPATSLASTTSKTLHRFATYVPSQWSNTKPARIAKVASNIHQNDLFESTLATHDAHNRRHGYDSHILRSRITDGWSTQAAYLLSIMISELEKPRNQRTEWLCWYQPDMILLNPQIPLEIFLPPSDLDHINLLATHDNTGKLDNAVFFLRVHEWSARLLLDVLSVSADDPEMQRSNHKDRLALARKLQEPAYRDHVTYQPRNWYNSYATSANSSEYEVGDMQLHFHGQGGDKWSGLSATLEALSSSPSDFSIPLARTAYRAETDAYWKRLGMALRTLQKAEPRIGEEGMETRVQRLGYATNFEMDKEKVMQDAIDGLRDALGVSNGEHAL